MSTEPLAGDDQAYAALEKEFGDKPEAVSQPEPDKVAETVETKETVSEEQPETQDKQPERLTYEELDRRYKNLNGALAETRAEARAAKEQAKQMQHVLTMLRQQAQPQDEFADPTQVELNRLNDATTQLAKQNEALLQNAARERDNRAIIMAVSEDEAEYASKVPDYNDAVQHLARARETELRMMYPEDDPNVIEWVKGQGYPNVAFWRAEAMAAEARNIARQAMGRGQRPAEVFYSLAKTRGWAGKPQAQEQPALKPAQPQKIETIRKGMDAPGSLNSGASEPSNNAEGFPSLSELADMYVSDPKKAESTFIKMKNAGLLG